MHCNFRFSPRATKRAAFTLLELVVTLTLLAILSTSLFCATRALRQKGRLTEDISASRRLIHAYMSAAMENNGMLPKGRYTQQEAPEILLPDGTPLSSVTQPVVLTRYPWHLAAYLGWNVDGTYVTWSNRKQVKGTFGQLASMPALARSQYYYTLSIAPAFGQNAYGVGGYERSAFSEAATRLAHVPEPGKLIVFASATEGTMEGYSIIEPPAMTKMTLRFDGTTEAVPQGWSNAPYQPDAAASFGHLAFHHNAKAVVAFLDGHTALLSLEELRDARLWSVSARENDDPDHSLLK